MKRRLRFITAIVVLFYIPALVPIYAEDEYVELAINQPAMASSEAGALYGAEKANDGINDNPSYTYWLSGEDDDFPWWQIDLGIEYAIETIEIEARKGTPAPEELRNFEIIASNNRDFSDFKQLAVQEAKGYKNGLWSASISAIEKFRYVRVRKTAAERFSIGEIRIWASKASMVFGSFYGQPNYDYETRFTIPDDIVGDAVEKQVTVLSMLNIMRGYSDGKFKPNANLSRAEFASIVVRLLNINPQEDRNSFSDVPKTHWAYESIESLVGLNIINGVSERFFEPDSPVSGDQAVKMLVLVLGYESVANARGGYPLGYNFVAREIGLISNAYISSSDSITRREAARLVFNALNCDVLKLTGVQGDAARLATSGDTLLMDKFKIIRDYGIVTAVNTTSLTRPVVMGRADYIEIDGEAYHSAIPFLNKYLGYNVEYYYSVENESEKEICAMLIKDDNNTIIVNAKDLNGIANNYMYYFDNGREKKALISDVVDVIYNQSALCEYNMSELLPDAGTVTLIDNGGKSGYDVMIIRDVKTHVVNWVNEKERTVFFKDPGEYLSLDLNNGTVSIIYAATNEPLTLDQLREWNIATVSESISGGGEKILEIIISDAFVRGEISEIGNDYMVIGSTFYELVHNFSWENISVGDRGVFYLDFEGRIAAFDGTESNYGQYGFLRMAAIEDGLNKTLQLRIFETNGKFTTYLTANKFLLDGDEYSISQGAEVINRLKASGRTAGNEAQLIRYTKNGMGKITSIDTLARGANETDESLTLDYQAVQSYYKETKIIGLAIAIDNATKMMRIPADLSHEDHYEILSTDMMVHDKTYTFEAYDGGENRVMKLLLFVSGSSPDIDDTEPLFLVDHIASTINENGEVVDVLYGLYKGEEKRFMEESSGVIKNAGLSNGDIAAILLTSSDKIRAVEKRFFPNGKTAEASEKSVSPDEPQYGLPYSAIYYGYGKVINKNKGNIIIKFDTSQPHETVMLNADYYGLNIYMYDREADKCELADHNDILDVKSAGEDNASSVFIRIQFGNVKELIIFK